MPLDLTIEKWENFRGNLIKFKIKCFNCERCISYCAIINYHLSVILHELNFNKVFVVVFAHSFIAVIGIRDQIREQKILSKTIFKSGRKCLAICKSKWTKSEEELRKTNNNFLLNKNHNLISILFTLWFSFSLFFISFLFSPVN